MWDCNISLPILKRQHNLAPVLHLDQVRTDSKQQAALVKYKFTESSSLKFTPEENITVPYGHCNPTDCSNSDILKSQNKNPPLIHRNCLEQTRWMNSLWYPCTLQTLCSSFQNQHSICNHTAGNDATCGGISWQVWHQLLLLVRFKKQMERCDFKLLGI